MTCIFRCEHAVEQVIFANCALLQLGQQFARVVKEKFDNGRRLRPEVIVSSPELLDSFNRECTSEWVSLVASVKSANVEAGKCFEEL